MQSILRIGRRRLSTRPAVPPPPALGLSPLVPAVALGLGVWLGSEPERPARVRAQLEAGWRAGRLLVTAAAIARDYRAAKSWTNEDSELVKKLTERHLEMQQVAGRAERERAAAAAGPSAAAAEEHARQTREEAVALGEEVARTRLRHANDTHLAAKWEALHQRSAERLLALCLSNGGVYVKLGQHVAQLDYLVPAPYTRTLSALFQHNAPSSIDAIAAVFEESLGVSVETAFESFEPTPVASASLAQVHYAVERRTGRKLAVKVQHPRLREASAADMAAVALAVRAAELLFPNDFRLGWVLDEVSLLQPNAA